MIIKGNSVGYPLPDPRKGLEMHGGINMNGQAISGLNAPTANDHAANRGYVNQQVRKAAPRNLLDNSDFRNPVNQRGQTSYTVAHEYFIDRWISSEGVTISVASNGLSLVNPNKQFTYIYQRLSKLKAGTYTQVLKFKNNTGTIELSNSYTEKGIAVGTSTTVEEGVIYATFTITEDDTNTPWFRFSSMGDSVFEWAALYEGEYTIDTLPKYQPKGYGAELAECLRYFQKNETDQALYDLFGDWKNTVTFMMPMRIVPTVTLYSDNTDLGVVECTTHGFQWMNNGKNQAFISGFEASADL